MPPADLRKALVEQLAYLIDEIEALKAIIGRVPEPVQAGRPLPTERSLKEIYGLLAALDADVHLPRFERLMADDDPAFDDADEDALVAAHDFNAQPVGALLGRVQAARRRLVDFLDALPPDAWTRTATIAGTSYDVYALAHAITQRDADTLRPLAYRLYEVEGLKVKG